MKLLKFIDKQHQFFIGVPAAKGSYFLFSSCYGLNSYAGTAAVTCKNELFSSELGLITPIELWSVEGKVTYSPVTGGGAIKFGGVSFSSIPSSVTEEEYAYN